VGGKERRFPFDELKIGGGGGALNGALSGTLDGALNGMLSCPI
jgi:hypothetical protein